ncbi:MAG: histidine kinase [Cyclobacteriaceae bacterium]|nr:histidine kinase [Cyclobacteriaceae bacterium]
MTLPGRTSLPQVLLGIIDYYEVDNIDSVRTYTNYLQSNRDTSWKTVAQAKWARALSYFNFSDSAELLLKKLGDKPDKNPMVAIERDLTQGLLFRNKNNYDLALTHFYRALDEIKKQKFQSLLPFVYTEIAHILSQNNDLKNCLKFFGYAFREAEKNKNDRQRVVICYKLCRIYNGGIKVHLDSSIYYGELGIKIAKESGNERSYVEMINIVAAPIIRNGQYRRGMEMSREALGFAKKYNFALQTQYYLILNQGFAYERLGIYDSAMQKMLEGARLRPMGIDHHRLKYLIYKAKGEYAKALAAYELYAFKSDSTIRTRHETKLSSLQARLEVGLKEKEVESLTQKAELQQSEIQKQRYFLITLILIVILVIGVGYAFYKRRQWKQKQAIILIELNEARRRLEIEKQYRASELKAIRSQMNPHFLFNALNSIQEYIMLNEKKLAGKYLGKFADLMRIYLQHSQSKSVTIQEEMEALRLYLELEKLRFNESFVYTIGVGDSIDTYSMSIPSLLVQPYVENAIKHGLLHKKQEQKLSIYFDLDSHQKFIICTIEDNGVGRVKSAEINRMRDPNHKSFATEATKTRLELLNYNNMDYTIGEQLIDLYDEAGQALGTRVILNIPLADFTS